MKKKLNENRPQFLCAEHSAMQSNEVNCMKWDHSEIEINAIFYDAIKPI